jgi:hypothetical protein
VLDVDNGPGVHVKQWISNGIDFMNIEIQVIHDARLYPAQLTHHENGTTYHAFRAELSKARFPDNPDLWPEYLDDWYVVDDGRYDNLATDAFIIGIDGNDIVQSIHVDALKVTMYRAKAS